jgi:ribonuclease P protein subunit POP4
MGAMGAMDAMDAMDGDADSPRPPNLVFELHGNQFEFRPADRASRKFKWKAMDYL